jgi:hypothetical protein
MRPWVTVLCLVLSAAVAGCLGSGGDRAGDGGDPEGATGGCGSATHRERSETSPVLAKADSDVPEGGNRTLRWDLAVDQACQASGASVRVEARMEDPPQNCPPLGLRASVTAGLQEHDIALAGDHDLGGTATVTPAREDLGEGPGRFVVSLSATFRTTAEAQDNECLDATLTSIGLFADFKADA